MAGRKKGSGGASGVILGIGVVIAVILKFWYIGVGIAVIALIVYFAKKNNNDDTDYQQYSSSSFEAASNSGVSSNAQTLRKDDNDDKLLYFVKRMNSDYFPATYKHFDIQSRLSTESDRAIIKELCLSDIMLAEKFKEEWPAYRQLEFDKRACFKDLKPLTDEEKEHYFDLPRYPSFQKLAIIHEKDGDFDAAISVCKRAIELGFTKETTKSGVEGRLQKLEKKRQAELDKIYKSEDKAE
jgi:hypothetical protein